MSENAGQSGPDFWARLEAALDAARTGLMAVDAQGAVTVCTPHAAELLAVQTVNGVRRIGASLRMMDGQALPSLLSAAGQLPLTVRAACPAGRERVLRISGSAERGTFLIQEQTGVDAGAPASVDEEHQLLDLVAHDLRAGLVPAKTYAQMLASGGMGDIAPAQRDALNAIDRCVQKQADRLSGMLDMVKAEDGRLSVQLELASFPDLVRKAVGRVERECQRRGVTLTVELEPGAALLQADPARLERVLAGLVSRALRQTPTGGAMGVEVRYDSEKRACLKIWDKGSGNNAKDVEFLTKPSRALAASRTQDRKLPDLELAACADILEQHHAKLEVQTAPGAGTSYLLDFPVQRRGAGASK